MPTPLRHFVIEGRHLGAAPCPEGTYSQTCLCQTCGELWAKFPVVYPDGRVAKFQNHYEPCPKHIDPDGRYPQGLFRATMDQEALTWPVGAVRWEFERALAWATKRFTD